MNFVKSFSPIANFGVSKLKGVGHFFLPGWRVSLLPSSHVLTLPGAQWLQFLGDKKQLSSKMLCLALQTSLKLTSRVIQATLGCYGNQHVRSAKNKIKISKKSLMLQPLFQYLSLSLCAGMCVCVCVPEWELGVKNHIVLFPLSVHAELGLPADLNYWGGLLLLGTPAWGPRTEHYLSYYPLNRL